MTLGRLERLGVLHLKDKPEELKAALEKKRQELEAHRKPRVVPLNSHVRSPIDGDVLNVKQVHTGDRFAVSKEQLSMNSPQSDQELGNVFRSTAESLGYSPDVLLRLAEAAAYFSRWAVMPNFGPCPQIENEEIISPEHLAAWPEWTTKLIPPGSSVENMIWPDGTTTIRLLSPRGLVLAAAIERPESTGSCAMNKLDTPMENRIEPTNPQYTSEESSLDTFLKSLPKGSTVEFLLAPRDQPRIKR
jgi:hypothetical protein